MVRLARFLIRVALWIVAFIREIQTIHKVIALHKTTENSSPRPTLEETL
jgi:hypothetical protein